MSVDTVLSEINKKFGCGTLVKGSDAVGLRIQRLPTGCAALDVALNGGWALGRLLELVGEFSTGKTTLACKAAIEFSKKFPDGYILYIDIEGAFDVDWFTALGGDPKKLIVCHPSSGEESGDIAIALLQHARKQGDHVFVVIDSVSALVPSHEVEEDMDNSMPATQARLVNKMLRKLTVELRKDLLSDDPAFTVMFLNQVRMKIGVCFGDNKTKSGGKGMDFFVSQQVHLTRKANIKADVTTQGTKRTVIYGMTVIFKVSKNKCQGFQNETGEFNLYIRDFENHKARSFDNENCILTSAVLYSIVERRNNSYVFEGKVFKSKKILEEAMMKDTALYETIQEAVMSHVSSCFTPVAEIPKKSKKTKLKLRK